ncbi:MAG: hypothetical protein JJU45_08330 [Acidimicrobiia bacterium]|nr:hypothetical protein [Acidimicrobiia bacterium]
MGLTMFFVVLVAVMVVIALAMLAGRIDRPVGRWTFGRRGRRSMTAGRRRRVTSSEDLSPPTSPD